MLIGITGYAQHGKDTFASFLVEEYGFVKVAFADKLREMALAIDPYVQLEGVLNNSFQRLSAVVERIGWDSAKKHPDVRRLLQRLGTEAGRNIAGENFWLELHAKEAEKYKRVVVTDVRFPNEGDYILNQGGFLIRIHDPRKIDNGVGTKHASEQFIERLPAKMIIINEGTIADLGSKAQLVFEAAQGVQK